MGTLSSSGSDNWLRGVALSMLRINPEYLELDASDRSAQADVLFREVPDEEEDEGDRKEDD